jgi:hypothetical protein
MSERQEIRTEESVSAVTKPEAVKKLKRSSNNCKASAKFKTQT